MGRDRLPYVVMSTPGGSRPSRLAARADNASRILFADLGSSPENTAGSDCRAAATQSCPGKITRITAA